MTTHQDGLYQFGGVPVNGFMTAGKTIFVKPISGQDAKVGKTPATAVQTLTRALALATANKGDVVYMIAEGNTAASTTDYQTAALDWNKNMVHLIGLNAHPFIGQRSRIAELSTVKTIEDLFTVSANHCFVSGIEVFQGVTSSTATAARAVVISGQRNRIEDCQISGNGDTGGSTDDSGARSLHVSGAENYFKNDYIGLDTVVRATQLTEVSVGAIPRTTFENCMINSWTSLSTFKALTAVSMDRFVLLKNCVLNAVQNITSAVAPTGAILNTTPNGSILILGGGVFGYADVSTLADTKILMLANWGLNTASNFPGVAQSVAPS